MRGTTRSPGRLADEAADGWQIHKFADDHPLDDAAAALSGVDAVISTITAIGGSDPVLDAHGDLLANFAGWTGYVSATSVYPDQPDGFCCEHADRAGDSARTCPRGGRKSLAGSHRGGNLRAAGIYGPGRSPFNGLRDGTARIIEHRGQVFNRIHVDDICRIIMAAMDKPRRGRIINLADNKPAAQGEVVRHAASLLGVAPPSPQTLEEANLSPMARSFYVSRRQVASKIIGPELGMELLYPDYESGLAAILDAERDS